MRLSQLINMQVNSKMNRFNQLQLNWLKENIKDITRIICGEFHTFLIKQDGTVWATGHNGYGQLGLGDTTNRNTFTQLPSEFNNPKMISCGGYHTFIVKQDGTVWATGRNYYGQLGLGDNNDRNTFTQISSSFNNPKMISCGSYYTFIVKQDGTVWATGSNYYGQLGLVGDTTNRNTFTQLPDEFNNPKMISCGSYYTFLVKQDGTVWATGRNSDGQLGLGDNTSRYTFTQLPDDFNNPKQISCGYDYTFIVKQDDTVWATGHNGYGQLGLGDTTNRYTFTKHPDDFNNPKQISCGYHTFIVKQDGTVWATGYNDSGQLGLGDTTNRNIFTKVNI
jgi:alpha-tubulin suppressor-like RCC1 family protein